MGGWGTHIPHVRIRLFVGNGGRHLFYHSQELCVVAHLSQHQRGLLRLCKMSVDPITITTLGGEVFAGDIHCIDPITKALVIKDRETGVYTLVNAEAISKIDGDLNNIVTPDPIKLGLMVQLSDAKIADRERKAMEIAERELESQNFGVDVKVQQLFDRLRNLFPTFRWEGANMIVFDALCISPPYDTITVRNGQSDDGIERLRKVLMGERSKLRM